MAHTEIKWKLTKTDRVLVDKIVERAVALYTKHKVKVDALHVYMDVTATHLNGCPLRLADMLGADEFNFMHDISGIDRHINRETGEIEGFFSPRFTDRVAEKALAAA